MDLELVSCMFLDQSRKEILNIATDFSPQFFCVFSLQKDGPSPEVLLRQVKADRIRLF